MRSDVVWQSGGRAVGGYGFEAVSLIAGDLGAELPELDSGVPFGDGVVILDAAIQPVEEVHHRQAVLQMAIPHSSYLNGIFHRLPSLHRGGCLHQARRPDEGTQMVVQFRRRDASVNFAHGNLYLLIITEEDAVLAQLCEGFLRTCILHILFQHEPFRSLRTHQQEGNHQRIVFYVGRPHVERPGDVIQGTQQHIIHAFLRYPVPQAAEALHAAFAGIHGENGSLRNARAVGPDGIQQVRHTNQMTGRAVGVQPGFYLTRETGPYAETVERYVNLALAGKLLPYPFGDGHLLRHAHLVEFHTGALELLHGLDEVAGICPQTCMVQGDHHVAGLAGEPGEPLHAFPALGGILAAVGVGPGDDHRIPSTAAHHRAQLFNPVSVYHICGVSSRWASARTASRGCSRSCRDGCRPRMPHGWPGRPRGR